MVQHDNIGGIRYLGNWYLRGDDIGGWLYGGIPKRDNVTQEKVNVECD